MKDIADAFDRLLSGLETVLRYIAPGFATLFIVAAVVPASRPFLSSGEPAVVVLGMLLGPAIYGVHTGFLLRILWPLVICVILSWRHGWQGANVRETMRDLDRQRWLRRASKDEEARAMQREMDKWAAMLNYLYCLSYLLILIPLLALLLLTESTDVNRDTARAVVFGGIFVLAATFWSEFGMSRKEMELADDYPEGTKKTTSANQPTTTAAPPSPTPGPPT